MTAPTMTTGRLTRQAVSNEDWRALGRCAEVDPELFFPVGRSREANRQRQEAKSVCAGCLVRRECLSWALDSGQYDGVAGGMDEDERWALTRQSATPLRRGTVRPAFDRAVASRDFIEEQVAAGVTLRKIALSLGVGHDAVRKARQFYLSEDAAQAAAGSEVAA